MPGSIPRFVAARCRGCSRVTAPVIANGRNHDREAGASPNPFPKNNPGLSVSVLFAATAWDPVPPMPQAMPAEIMTSCISFLYKERLYSDSRRVKARALCRPPIAMEPASVELDCERWRQES